MLCHIIIESFILRDIFYILVLKGKVKIIKYYLYVKIYFGICIINKKKFF